MLSHSLSPFSSRRIFTVINMSTKEKAKKSKSELKRKSYGESYTLIIFPREYWGGCFLVPNSDIDEEEKDMLSRVHLSIYDDEFETADMKSLRILLYPRGKDPAVTETGDWRQYKVDEILQPGFLVNNIVHIQ